MRFVKVNLCLSIFYVSLMIYANEVIFDFTEGDIGFNGSIAAEKRGVRVERMTEGGEGVLVYFDKYVKGNSEWSYIDVRSKSLRTTDWSGYKTLIVKIENPGVLIPDFKVTIRDRDKKRVTENLALQANSTREYFIDLTKVAKTINPARISWLDFAMSRSKTSFNIKMISLALSKESANEKVIDPNRVVSRIYDLRKDISRASTQGLKIEAQDINDIRISNDVWTEGMPRYPTLSINADQNGALNNGDLGVMTHLCYEFEQLSGYGNYLGLMIRAGGKRMWHGIGTVGEGLPIYGKQQVWGTELDMTKAQSITLNSVGSFNANSYRVKKLQLEFRPEVLLEQLMSTLSIVSRQNLNHSERERFGAIEKMLKTAYSKIKGETFIYQDAIDFNRYVGEAKQTALELLREHNRRVLPTMTAKDYGVGIADSMTSVFLQGPGSEIYPATKFELEMAGNEYESFQVVILAGDTPLENIRVEVDKPVDTSGNTMDVECAVVGHAKTKRLNYPQEYVGFYPNFIISYQQNSHVEPNETVPFWVRLKTPDNAVPGTYRTTVRISGDNIKPYNFPVEVKVFNFSLPAGSVLPSAFHINDINLTNFYKAGKDPEMSKKLTYGFIDLCAKYKIPYNHLYWEHTTADSRREYFEKLKYLNDKGLLDKFAWCTFNLTRKPGNSRYKTDYWMSPEDPEIDRFIAGVKDHMEKWLPLCREFGIADKGYFYAFDEGSMNATTARILSELKKAYPNVPVMTCGRFGSPDLPAVKDVDIWVTIAPQFISRPDLTTANRKVGRQVWWYVCNFPRPPEPTLMLDVPAVMPRLLMGIMTYKYQPDGFLYWSVIAWRKKHEIITYGPRTNWDAETVAGDCEEGNLFGPGMNYTVIPSIRVENYRDGIEDHWYYELLAREIKKNSNNINPQILKEAKAALNVPEKVVRGSAEYTIDPQLIRMQRQRVAKLLEKLRK